MTRKDIKILAQRKLKRRVAMYDILLVSIFIINSLVTYVLKNSPNGFMTSILSLCNVFLLRPFTAAAIVVYTVNLVNREGKFSFKEAIPSVKVWISFIKKLFVIIIFEIPAFIIAIMVSIRIMENMALIIFEAIEERSYIGIEEMMINYIACILIFIGILLIYNIILNLYLFPVKYIIVDDEECGIWEAVGRGMKIMKGHKWELFVLELSMIGWALLSLITVGIGFLWYIPYRDVVYRIYYLSLIKDEFEIGQDQQRKASDIDEVYSEDEFVIE